MSFIKSVAKGFLVTLFVIFFFGFLIALAIPSPAETRDAMQGIQTSVAEDMVRQYEDTVKHGLPIDQCVRAGLVAEGYLQAGDSAEYERWQAIKLADCEKAGIISF